MKQNLIRYRTSPQKGEENERLIQGVIRELQEKSPEGVRYLALKVGDGGFVHFFTAETAESSGSLTGLEAFKAFQRGMRDRCLEPPLASEVAVIGNYRMLIER